MFLILMLVTDPKGDDTNMMLFIATGASYDYLMRAFWLALEGIKAKHLASANKSDPTVKNLIWLHKFTFAIHIFS